ncbi:MAG: transglycosylase SLT domain-containing protein [Nitrospirae bacterium]|nr:transglycosylase SLT domain-containing protein [Nitrospirota bacterium]
MKQKEIMMPTLITLKSFSRRSPAHLFSLLFSVLVAIVFAYASFSPSGLASAAEGANAVNDKNYDAAQSLLQGKNSLENGEYDKAILLLTAAYEKLPVIGDYALLWRSKAYEGKENHAGAIEDLRTIKLKYKESPLLKKARLSEIELLLKQNDPSAGKSLDSLVREYPSNMELKYMYAQYLKANNERAKAKELLREVFSSVCPLSANAYNELSPSDITVEDLIKKGKALISVWQFDEAEKTLREALGLNNDNSRDKPQIIDNLAYSLFMQKKYREAAELYKKTNNAFWRARSVFRTGDMDAFKAEIPEFESSRDKRMAEVMIAYGSMRRREGNSEEALQLFDDTLKLYPAAREEVLWATGWAYYLSRDYKKASKFLSLLAETYGEPKYTYWNRKCKELLGDKEKSAPFPDREGSHDFYAYMNCLRNKCKQTPIIRASLTTALNSRVAERVDILSKIGLKDEAASELLLLSKKNPATAELVSISSNLKKLGHYKTSVAIISKLAYREELHELYYPLAFWPEVAEAANMTSFDPYLILAVMREESRYEPQAQSVAGAIGLMQLMPKTAYKYNKNVKVNLKNTLGLYNARTNILLGSYYLKHLLNRFGSIPLALASYNAGEDAVKDWLKRGKYLTVDEFIEDIPYGETKNYVKKVMTSYFEYLRSNGNSDVSLAHTHMGEL